MHDEGLKDERLKEYITRAVNAFVAKNSDRLGFCFVEAVILSGDLRSAKILVIGDNTMPANELAKLLNHEKNHVNEELKKVFSSKYLPKISFITSQ